MRIFQFSAEFAVQAEKNLRHELEGAGSITQKSVDDNGASVQALKKELAHSSKEFQVALLALQQYFVVTHLVCWLVKLSLLTSLCIWRL